VEVGGTYASTLRTAGPTSVSPLVAAAVAMRQRIVDVELSAGYDATASLLYAALSHVYHADLSVMVRPLPRLALQAATGYRLQALEMRRANGIAVDRMDIYYGSAGSTLRIKDELSLFVHYLYRNQNAGVAPTNPLDVTFVRHVAMLGARFEWPPITQRRLGR
jgi:hypothetical protein